MTILQGYSTTLGTLPQKIDVLLHEIIGEVAGAEGVVAAIHDARRHMAQLHPLNEMIPPTSIAVSVPARALSLLAPCEFPPADYFASLPHPMIAAPGARALKLPSLPHAMRLAQPQVFEDLRFEWAAPRATQNAELEFEFERAGLLRGACVHIELRVVDGEASHPEVSSASSDSHWPNVLLLLEDEVAVEEQQRLLVHTTMELGGPQPSYTFKFLLSRKQSGNGEEPINLGEVTYPE